MECRYCTKSNDYVIFADGNIYSRLTKKMLKSWEMKDGYMRIGLRICGKRKMYLVHRLVAEAFLGEIRDGLEVNHINAIKSDNRVENLEIVTPRENQLHTYKLGLRKPCMARCKPVEMYSKDGCKLNEFISMTEAERITGINESSICAVCRGRLKSTGGYIWKYKEAKE